VAGKDEEVRALPRLFFEDYGCSKTKVLRHAQYSYREVRIVETQIQGGIMSIPIVAAGNGAVIAPAPEFRQPERAAAAVQKIVASLPGNAPHRAVESTAADLERVSFALNRKLKFMVDHESHEVTVKVIDPETDKVIKILPPEELQRLHSRIQETIGFLFDERV
jgi:flagellar protein FlaG